MAIPQNRITFASRMPRDHFIWRGLVQITSRQRTDQHIQDMMRRHGDEAMKEIHNDKDMIFQFTRQHVVDLLVHMLGCLEDALRDEASNVMDDDLNLNDFNVDFMSAITLVQAQITWVGAISAGEVLQLVLELLAAKRSYDNEHLHDKAWAFNEETATSGERLCVAVRELYCTISIETQNGRWQAGELLDKILHLSVEELTEYLRNPADDSDLDSEAGDIANHNTGTLFGGQDIGQMMAEMEEMEEEEREMMEVE